MNSWRKELLEYLKQKIAKLYERQDQVQEIGEKRKREKIKEGGHEDIFMYSIWWQVSKFSKTLGGNGFSPPLLFPTIHSLTVVKEYLLPRNFLLI